METDDYLKVVNKPVHAKMNMPGMYFFSDLRGAGKLVYAIKVNYHEDVKGRGFHDKDETVLDVVAAHGLLESLERNLAHSNTDLYKWAKKKVGKE